MKDAVTAAQPETLAALLEQVKAIKEITKSTDEKVTSMNGSVRDVCIQVAQIDEWRTGHKDTHSHLDKEVDKAVGRSNLALRLEAVITLLLGYVGIRTGGGS